MVYQNTYIYAAVFCLLCVLSLPTHAQDHAALLKDAIELGNITAVKELIQQGVNPNQRWIDGTTPLHLAAAEDPAIAKALINAGADVNAKDDFNVTPLGEATEFGNIETIYDLADNNALLNEGAQPNLDVNFNPNEVYIPLHQAVKAQDVDVIQALLSVGADVNAKNSQKETALHHATEKRQVDIARMLLDRQADPNVTSTMNTTPLNIASKKEYAAIVELLLDHGADITPKDRRIAHMHGNKRIHKIFGDYIEREHLFDRLKQAYYAQQSQLGSLPPEMIENITGYVRTPPSKSKKS